MTWRPFAMFSSLFFFVRSCRKSPPPPLASCKNPWPLYRSKIRKSGQGPSYRPSGRPGVNVPPPHLLGAIGSGAVNQVLSPKSRKMSSYLPVLTFHPKWFFLFIFPPVFLRLRRQAQAVSTILSGFEFSLRAREL